VLPIVASSRFHDIESKGNVRTFDASFRLGVAQPTTGLGRYDVVIAPGMVPDPTLLPTKPRDAPDKPMPIGEATCRTRDDKGLAVWTLRIAKEEMPGPAGDREPGLQASLMAPALARSASSGRLYRAHGLHATSPKGKRSKPERVGQHR
jgi:hypothetical protein